MKTLPLISHRLFAAAAAQENRALAQDESMVWVTPKSMEDPLELPLELVSTSDVWSEPSLPETPAASVADWAQTEI